MVPGPDENFFDVGGHSLLAIRAVARIKEQAGVDMTPMDILSGTLEQIAAKCTSEENGSAGT